MLMLIARINALARREKKIVWWRLEKRNAQISLQLNGLFLPENQTENFHDFIEYQFSKLVKKTSDLFGILRAIEDVKMQPPIVAAEMMKKTSPNETYVNLHEFARAGACSS